MEIQNITLTTELGRKLNLLSLQSPGATYNPAKFPGLILRLKQPKATLLIFKSGKIVCVGVKSIENGKLAIETGLQLLQLQNSNDLDIHVQLLVGSANIGYKINLCKLYEHVNRKCFYEQEIFPGLVYKLGKITFLLFSSGKMIVTGAKFEYELHRAYKIMSTILEKCKIA